MTVTSEVKPLRLPLPPTAPLTVGRRPTFSELTIKAVSNALHMWAPILREEVYQSRRAKSNTPFAPKIRNLNSRRAAQKFFGRKNSRRAAENFYKEKSPTILVREIFLSKIIFHERRAVFKTSSIFSTGTNSNFSRTLSGMSSISGAFSFGRIIVCMPSR